MGWLIRSAEEKEIIRKKREEESRVFAEALRREREDALAEKGIVFNGRRIIVGVDVADCIVGGLYFYDEHECFLVSNFATPFSFEPSSFTAVGYSEIVRYELLENGASITKAGGVGRALVGGIVAGGAGAVVGASTAKRSSDEVCKTLQVVVTVKKERLSTVKADFLRGSQPKRSSAQYSGAFSEAQRCMAKLEELIRKYSASSVQTIQSPADEIRKFKGLMDDGIITEAEYEAKKRQLLEA